MAPYDWNKNGRNDSFDRYMDYKASHPESNNRQQTNQYNENNGYSKYNYSSPSIDAEGQKNSHMPEENQDYLSPSTIIAAIISIIFGVVLAVVWLNAVN